MAKYFKSRLIYFHEPDASENKLRVKYLVIITLTSVISGFFHARYLH